MMISYLRGMGFAGMHLQGTCCIPARSITAGGCLGRGVCSTYFLTTTLVFALSSRGCHEPIQKNTATPTFYSMSMSAACSAARSTAAV
jgi:hypothetical protein